MMRFEQRKQDYFNALERLREALKEADSDIVIDGVFYKVALDYINLNLHLSKIYVKIVFIKTLYNMFL